MTIVTIDGRTFVPTVIMNTITKNCTLKGEENSYIDYFFTEDGKQHIARQKTHFNSEDNTFIVDQDLPAEWYVQE